MKRRDGTSDMEVAWVLSSLASTIEAIISQALHIHFDVAGREWGRNSRGAGTCRSATHSYIDAFPEYNQVCIVVAE